MNVTIQISKVMEIDCNNFCFLGFLTYVMNHDYNLHAKDFLHLLQNSPILLIFLHNLTVNFNFSQLHISKLVIYLEFLKDLVIESYERPSILYDQEGQHVLKAVDSFCEHTILAVHQTTTMAYLLSRWASLVAHLTKMHPEAIENNDQRSILWFLNMGGMACVSNIFMTLVSHPDMCGDIFVAFYKDILMIFDSLSYLNTTDLDRELYCIDRNSAYRMTVAFYKLLSEEKVACVSYSISMIYCYTAYLEHHDLVSELEALLLYKPPRNDAFVIKLLRSVRNSNFANSTSCEVDFIRKFNVWVSRFPAVAALLDEPLREVPPDRDDKVRVCAYPGCNIDGKGLFNKMMKCGRCRSVYYCNSWHQKEHWKEHKQTCGSSVPTTADTSSC